MEVPARFAMPNISFLPPYSLREFGSRRILLPLLFAAFCLILTGCSESEVRISGMQQIDANKTSACIHYIAFDPKSAVSDESSFAEIARLFSASLLDSNIDSIVGTKSKSLDTIFAEARKYHSKDVLLIDVRRSEPPKILDPFRKVEIFAVFYDVESRKQYYSIHIDDKLYGFCGWQISDVVHKDIDTEVLKYSQKYLRGLL